LTEGAIVSGPAAGGFDERGDASRAPLGRTDSRRAADSFYDLGDAEKVKFSQNEIASTLAHLDKLLTDLDGLRAAVDDPDGLVSLTLGFDGRMLDIQLADGIGHVMTNLDLEKRLNTLLAAGTEGVDDLRNDLL
jgi:hypothetical protein